MRLFGSRLGKSQVSTNQRKSLVFRGRVIAPRWSRARVSFDISIYKHSTTFSHPIPFSAPIPIPARTPAHAPTKIERKHTQITNFIISASNKNQTQTQFHYHLPTAPQKPNLQTHRDYAFRSATRQNPRSPGFCVVQPVLAVRMDCYFPPPALAVVVVVVALEEAVVC